MFELICCAYWASYFLPVSLLSPAIVLKSQFIYLTETSIAEALKLVVMAILALIAGFYFIPMNSVAARLRLTLQIAARYRSHYIYSGLILGFILLFLQATGITQFSPTYAALMRILYFQPNIALILLAYDVYSRQSLHYHRDRLTLIAAMIFFALASLTSGMLEFALTPLVSVFVVRWHTQGRLPKLWLILGASSMLILNAVKMDYRSSTWLTTGSMSAVQQLALWRDLARTQVENIFAPGDSARFYQSVLVFVSRLDYIRPMAHIVELTPSHIPYFNGRTYSYFIYGWIPRVLWPDKPIAQEANKILPLEYGFQLESQLDTTMIGIGHVSEAYANFGPNGLVLIMLLQGMVYSLLDRSLNGSGSDGARAIYIAIMISFLNGIGSSTAGSFMSILPNLLVSALILRPFLVRKVTGRGA